MESRQSNNGGCNIGIVPKEENCFAFPSQLAPLDFSWFPPPLDLECDIPTQDSLFDALPIMQNDASYKSLDVDSGIGFQDDLFSGMESGFEVWNDGVPSLDADQRKLKLGGGGEAEEGSRKEMTMKRYREEKSNSSNALSRETISQYFYMPITRAAKELKVGLTLLKKRCRELGIRRWPHRKLMSLQTLIQNVQGLGREEGEENEAKLKQAIELLEREKKLLEDIPDMELEDKTKRLRQACFKANYKKRKFMDSQSSSNNICSYVNGRATSYSGIDEEEIRNHLYDSSSSTNVEF